MAYGVQFPIDPLHLVTLLLQSVKRGSRCVSCLHCDLRLKRMRESLRASPSEQDTKHAAAYKPSHSGGTGRMKLALWQHWQWTPWSSGAVPAPAALPRPPALCSHPFASSEPSSYLLPA